jgi:hypothetical protein
LWANKGNSHSLHPTMCMLHRPPDKNLHRMLQLDRKWKFVKTIPGNCIFPVQSHQNK